MTVLLSVIIWTHLDGSQLKDPGSNRPDYELDDLVDDMEDAYSKLSDLDQCIPLEELKVTSICLCDKTEVGLGYNRFNQEGLQCAVKNPAERNSKWYRAVIFALDGHAVQVLNFVLLIQETTSQVYLLDFGLVVTVPNSPEYLKNILPQFCSCMPAQVQFKDPCSQFIQINLFPPGHQSNP